MTEKWEYVESDVLCRDCQPKWTKSKADGLPQTYMGVQPCERHKAQYWQCGCGHKNGYNLATCALCNRRPGETR